MIHSVKGVSLGVAQAGIKRVGRDDLVLISLAPGTQTSAMFTRNTFRAAPVRLAEQHITANGGLVSHWLINTGNANAGTGAEGEAAALACCAAVARMVGGSTESVLPFSTGVIGEPLPAAAIIDALETARADLSEDNWQRASSAILTTDTRPKLRSSAVQLGDDILVMTGMAKGAGMICPNLATMLAFVGTDARVPDALLERALKSAVDRSFNRITVDGDTSTNDAVAMAATGCGSVVIDESNYGVFEQALTALMIDLAQDIVRDGEGATKFVELRVSGGQAEAECDQVARTIAHSPLVKTALFASDPNWGRLLAAIGRAGIESLDVDAVSIRLNDVLIAEKGARAKSYDEAQGQAAMAPSVLKMEVALGRGSVEAVLWTTDLSYDYVKINAEYRT